MIHMGVDAEWLRDIASRQMSPFDRAESRRLIDIAKKIERLEAANIRLAVELRAMIVHEEPVSAPGYGDGHG